MDVLELEMFMLRERLRFLETQSGRLSEDAQPDCPESDFFRERVKNMGGFIDTLELIHRSHEGK
jgi:hypothetical protein